MPSPRMEMCIKHTRFNINLLAATIVTLIQAITAHAQTNNNNQLEGITVSTDFFAMLTRATSQMDSPPWNEETY